MHFVRPWWQEQSIREAGKVKCDIMKPPSMSSFSSRNTAPCPCPEGMGIRECIQRWCRPIPTPQGTASSHPLCLTNNTVKNVFQNLITAMLCTSGWPAQGQVQLFHLLVWLPARCPLMLPASDRWNAATEFCASKLLLVPCTWAFRNILNLLQKEITDSCL